MRLAGKLVDYATSFLVFTIWFSIACVFQTS